MDKQTLLEVVKNLGVSDEVKNILSKYIEDNETNPALAENVSKVLEAMADQTDMVAEQMTQLLDKLEDYQDVLQTQADKYEEGSSAVIEKFQTDSLTGVDELNNKYAKNETSEVVTPTPVQDLSTPMATESSPQANPGYGGQQYNSAAVSSTQPAAFPTAPVMGE